MVALARLGEYDVAGFFAAMLEADVAGVGGNQRARTLRPLDDQHRTFRKIILPADRQHVILAVQTVEVHVDEESDRGAKWLGGWVAGWLGGWVTKWLSGWVAGWLGGWVAGWLGGWVAGWLGGWVAG